MVEADPSPSEPGGPGATPADLERRLMEALVRASPDAVVVVDTEGRIRLASPSVKTLFGYEPAELIAQSIEILVPDQLRAGHVSYRQGYMTDLRSRPMGQGLALSGLRKDGSTFAIDVALAPVSLDGEGWVGAFVRDVTERRRGEAVLEYGNEVNQRLLSDGDTGRALALIAQRARTLVGASAAWIVTPAGPELLTVAAADGAGTGGLLGVELPAVGSLSGQAIVDRTVVWVEDMASDPAVIPQARAMGLGPGLYVPLADDIVLGALVVAREPGTGPFSAADAAVAEVFASAAGVALSFGQARQQVEELRLATEHDRIARELHDTVIQKLFALGMGLQGALRLVSGPGAERVSAAVDAIDGVIREIRETIFDLQTPVSARALRQQVREVTEDAAQHLGFSPAVVFLGPVESAVDEKMGRHLLAVVREGLSNVVRHARASEVEVVIEARDEVLCVRISDNGVGPSTVKSSGRGLVNLEARAREHGGRFDIGPGPLGGTVLEWQVSLARSGPVRS